MSRKHWILVFAGILAVHAILFLLIKDGPVIPPQWLKYSSMPEPTFKYKEAKYVDPDTGEKMIVKEFTVKAIADPGNPFPSP